MVTDPAGTRTFFALDTLLTSPSRLAEARQGAKLCDSTACQDRVNNVEQVIVSDPNGAPLANGTWTASVSAHSLGEPRQKFSLVVTPDECPVRIFNSTTLTGPVDCPYDPLEPVAVSVEADDVELDCDEHSVSGAGNNIDGFLGRYAGIRTGRDGVEVSDCEVRNFDVGIDYRDNADGRIERATVRRSGTAGIRVAGERHTVQRADVSDVRKPGGDGILATGKRHSILDSEVNPHTSSAETRPAAGIRLEGSGGGVGSIADNAVVFATTGIQINSDVTDPLDGYLVSGNSVGAVDGDGIRVTGPMRNSTITANEIEGFGTAHAAIKLQAKRIAAGAPATNIVSSNRIIGAGSPTQTGVSLVGDTWVDAAGAAHQERPLGNQVFGHLAFSGVAVGINELLGQDNEIFGNLVGADAVGIQSADSLGNPNGRHIVQNIVSAAPVGIAVSGPSRPFVGANVIAEARTGVLVDLIRENRATVHNFNAIGVLPGGTGIQVRASEDVLVERNAIKSSDPAIATGVGIVVENSTLVTAQVNAIRDLSTGITVSGTPDVAITGNAVNNASAVGIKITADRARVVANGFESVPNVGIHYVSGSGGVIQRNGLSPTVAGTHGIALGDISGLPFSGSVTGVSIADQVVEGFANGVTIGDRVASFSLRDGRVVATGRALDGEDAAALVPRDVLITGNTLTGGNNLLAGNRDAFFAQPVDTSDNTWSEVAGMDIVDGDGDGDGDCGTDHVFSSSDYTGARAGVARTSVRTSQISDEAPVTATTGTCP